MASAQQQRGASSGYNLTRRFDHWLTRHRGSTIGVLAGLVTATFVAAQILPEVGDFIVSRGLIPYVTLLIVFDIALSIQSGRGDGGRIVMQNQDVALPHLEAAADRCREHGADLLEYAGQSILPLVRVLHQQNVPIRILVQHPDLIRGLQRQRNFTTLDTLLTDIGRPGQAALEVRCYRAPYTLRGRRLGKHMLELGWLTPDLDRLTAHGHDNPSLLLDVEREDNYHLREFFQRTFEDLWEAKSTERGEDVLQKLQAELGDG